jgi:hypothetical protein
MHNRQRERALLKRKLEAGLSVHMPAPRRIGKTWTMSRLARDLRGDGWHVIECDVEGTSTPQEFARELCSRIEAQISVTARSKAHVSQRLSGLLGGNWGEKPLDALARIDPVEFTETLIASLHEMHQPTAIFIDEISYFFLALAEKDAQTARTFAYQLRALQQRYKNVRWLITGSIGLNTIARRYGLEGAFVDFETIELEPFTPDEARSYLRDRDMQQQFSHPFDASDADFDAVFAELGWLAPYYLKLIANELRPSHVGTGDQRPVATRADFEAAFEKLLQPNRRSEFAIWREHIDKNLPAPDRDMAKHVLGFLSRRPDGETDDTILAQVTVHVGAVTRPQLRDVLAMLTNDGLILKSGPRYAFRSGLVRRYWQYYEAD